jgi:hypothetical protein
MWFPIGYTGYKWPARSVERLPPFRRQKLRNQILVIGNTGDPVTPVTSARFVVELLGDQAVMVEQLGFGHTTLAESSNCTDRIVADHIMRGVVSLFCVERLFSSIELADSCGCSSRRRRRPNARSTVPMVDSLPCSLWRMRIPFRNLWSSVRDQGNIRAYQSETGIKPLTEAEAFTSSLPPTSLL